MERCAQVVLLAATVLALSSCAVSPEHQARKDAEQEMYLNMLVGRCLSEGFRPQDGQMFEQCINRQHANCQQARNAVSLEFYSALAASGSRPGARFNESVAAAERRVDTSRLCR